MTLGRPDPDSTPAQHDPGPSGSWLGPPAHAAQGRL